MFKPDIVWWGVGDIEPFVKKRLEKFGLCVMQKFSVTMNDEFVLSLWPTKPREELLARIDEICGMSLPVWILMGEDAITKTMEMKKRLRETFRNELLFDPYFQGFHCPDTAQDMEREWGIFFPNIPYPT